MLQNKLDGARLLYLIVRYFPWSAIVTCNIHINTYCVNIAIAMWACQPFLSSHSFRFDFFSLLAFDRFAVVLSFCFFFCLTLIIFMCVIYLYLFHSFMLHLQFCFLSILNIDSILSYIFLLFGCSHTFPPNMLHRFPIFLSILSKRRIDCSYNVVHIAWTNRNVYTKIQGKRDGKTLYLDVIYLCNTHKLCSGIFLVWLNNTEFNLSTVNIRKTYYEYNILRKRPIDTDTSLIFTLTCQCSFHVLKSTRSYYEWSVYNTHMYVHFNWEICLLPKLMLIFCTLFIDIDDIPRQTNV